MHKKILMLILAVLVSFTGITPAFANENESITDDYSYMFAKGTLNTLGVTFTSDDELSGVTRGEFVSALVSLGGMATVSGKEAPYADVTTDSPYYSAVKTAYTLSWISDAAAFNPDESITLVQALKIGIHAIGGEYQAAFYGGYPVGYAYLGNALDFNENIASSNDEALTIRDAYVLLYNIIFSKTFMVGFEGDGNVSVSFGDSSILEKYHDMYIHEGVLTANTVTNLYDETEKGREKLKVGNEEFIDQKGLLEYLGCSVRVLYKKDGNKKYAEFVAPFDTNVITLNSSSIIDCKSNIVYYGEDEKEESKLYLNSGFAYVLNGKTTILTTDNLNSVLKDKTSVLTFIDNDGDNKYDVVSVRKYNYSFVGRFDLYDGLIYDAHSVDALIDLSAEDCKITVRSYQNGKYSDASIHDIKSGMVVAAALSADKTFADIVLCHDTAEGIISEKTDSETVVIEGVEYEFSDYYKANYTYRINEEIEFCLGLNGEIVAESGGKSKMKYAFIIDSSFSEGLNKEVLLKVFDQSGNVLVLGVADKLKKDAASATAQDIYTFAQGLTADKDKFIRYSLNDDDKINCIDTYVNKIDDVESYGADNPDDNSLTLHFEGNYLPRGNKIFADGAGQAKFNYSATEHIFVLPEEAERSNEDLYRIADASEIKTNSSNYDLDLICYDTDTSGSPNAMLVVGGYLQSSNSVAFLSGYGVVEKITDAVDSEGENAKKVYLCTTTGYKSYYLRSKVSDKYFVPAPGDVVGFSAKGDSITYLLKCFDFATYTIDPNFVTESAENSVVTGFVYSIYGGYIHYFPAEMQTATLPVIPETIDYSKMRNSNYSAATVVHIDAVRSADGTVVESVTVNPNPETKMKDIKTCGKDSASFIVNRMTYNSSKEIFSYNITYR